MPGNANIMDEQSTTIRLLVTATSSAIANRMISDLRHAGLSINAAHTCKGDELATLLCTHSWDVLVCHSFPALSAPAVLQTVQQQEAPLSVLVVDDHIAATARQALFREGACDVIATKESERLVRGIRRESAYRQLHRRLAALELDFRQTAQRLSHLMDDSPAPYACMLDGLHIYCNSSYAALFEYPDTDTIRTTPFLDLVAQQDREKVRNLLQAAENNASICIRGLTLNGSVNALKCLFTPTRHNGKNCLQLKAEHDSGNAQYREELEKLQSRDLLTRLENRKFFKNRIEKAILKAYESRIFSALLVVELNALVDISSSIGKANANMVLNDIAAWLQKTIKMPFAAARLDAHVFGLLVYESNPDRIILLGREIRTQINKTISPAMQDTREPGCSIGMSLINDNSHDAESVLERARTRLPQGHPENESPFSFCGNETGQHGASGILRYLQMALQQKKFRLVYQPVIDLRGQNHPGYEVLSRMLDSDGKETSPDTYLWLANLNGLGEQLDRLVASMVLEQLANQALEESLVLKITPNTLVSRTFLPWLSEQLSFKRVNCDRLTIEISEIDLYSTRDCALNFCHGLAELGIGISICHFGCAIDPYPILDEIKPAFIKFDVTLVRDIIYSTQQRSHVQKMIQTLHARNTKVLIPNVEDKDVLPVLWESGADFVQGFALQSPCHEMRHEFMAEKVITLAAQQ